MSNRPGYTDSVNNRRQQPSGRKLQSDGTNRQTDRQIDTTTGNATFKLNWPKGLFSDNQERKLLGKVISREAPGHDTIILSYISI